ncbi:hypothetical protein P3T37_004143 [Kitasatospora sp. MAA4]|uniref:S53 family peptidase n=1 Tax=Kitasatospora sp. MAA4 TaxID=3035093 RepID=UPI002474FF15|nr:S53 family peptidase [Kitasatospora sp. MAA4]MDH6134739.1 hypothetical protein [Kitasatospora sp. MAA4]
MATPLDPLSGPRIPHNATKRLLTGGACVAVVAALLTPGTALADSPTPAPVRVGSAPAAPAGATPVAAPADDTALQLSVTLSPRDPAALKSFLHDVSTPTSSRYHQYLKTGQFAQVFGADKATVDSVTQALTAAGLHPGALGSDGLTIPVDTTVAQAKKSFGTGFAGYKLADGSTAYANTAAPTLSAKAATAVTAVVGLDNLARTHNHLATAHDAAAVPNAKASATLGSHATGTTPQICTSLVNYEASNFQRANNRDYYSYDALAQAYNMTGQTVPNGGAGVTVALYELEDYSDSGVSSFQNCYGTNTPISRVKVDGGPTAAPTNDGNVGGESALDIDTVIGLAPKASILVYQGPDANMASSTQTVDVLRQIVNDNKAQVISTSWGVCETALLDPTNGAPAQISAENQVFEQAAAQGQTVVAASGDSGSMDCSRPGAFDSRLSTDDPASQPYVTGVGGTSMTGQGASVAESVWFHGGAGGGGISQAWALDSATGFQAGFTGPGYSGTPCHAGAGQACRQVPDVSALADPYTGYLVAVNADASSTYWLRMGGTSAAAPVWAAIAAQADASSACTTSGPVGLLNPTLYKLAGSSSLRDVTVGDNNFGAVSNSPSAPAPLYEAGPGYDMASGLGTPNGGNLASSLCVPGSTFAATPPTRLLDTRAAVGTPGTTKVPAFSSVPLQITGRAGIPSAGVTAVVLNVTTTDSATDGHLTVYPSGGIVPSTSNLNWTAGEVIPNLVTVPVGADGKVVLLNSGWGPTHLVADVFGYYTSSNPTGPSFTSAGPNRLLDTRGAIGTPTSTPIPSDSAVSLQVAGRAGIPATGVTAVVLNVTVTAPTSEGFLTVVPSGTTPIGTSNLNWKAGETIPNQVIVPVGPDGKVTIYNSSLGTTHVVADVFGYFSAAAPAGSAFHTSFPRRLMDTRSGLGTNAAALGSGETRQLHLDTTTAVGKAKAVVLNVTVTEPTSEGFLTAWPTGGSRPNSSNLNWTAGETIPNLVTVPVGPDGIVNLTNVSAGNTHVIVDLFGYYS